MKYLLGWACFMLSTICFAQPEVVEEEIFNVVQEMPMFPGCVDSTGNLAELKSCADKKMLSFMYSNLQYPEIDRIKGNEGTVVLQFVVEKDGTISNSKIVRDRGEKLGQEALRVLNQMNEMADRWTPGKQKGVPVRVYFTLPVKFKIQEIEEPDFIINEKGDSIWVRYSSPAVYKSGEEELAKYIDQSLQYPNEGQDSCRIGIVEVNSIIRENGALEITDVVDYSKLGIDYQFEAIRLINATNGSWTAADYSTRKVNTTRAMRITFRPNLVACGNVINDFEESDKLVDEASILIQQEKTEEGIAKLTEAINKFPENGEYISMRGQAYLNMQKTEEACADLRKAKEILVVSWYDSLIPLLCK